VGTDQPEYEGGNEVKKERGKRMGRVESYTDAEGKFRWRIKANNGRVLADSGEGYSRAADCAKSLAVVLSDAKAWGRFEVQG